MSKIKIEIKSLLTGSVLFEYTKENNTFKDTLIKAVEKRANLRGADLTGANLMGADLMGANLRDASLRGANLRDANMRNADLKDANMTGADLMGANLMGADLTGANMRDASLRDANMRNANMTGANLRDASLTVADLTGANLRDANMTGANLISADLMGADLRDADLEPIKTDFFNVLLHAIPEIKNLKTSLIEGKIDGSTYAGECACLCGTLEKSSSVKIKNKIQELRDSSRPIERFFLLIRPCDTPENNQAAKIVMKWIEEFEELIKLT